jgi:hypothetical protein
MLILQHKKHNFIINYAIRNHVIHALLVFIACTCISCHAYFGIQFQHIQRRISKIATSQMANRHLQTEPIKKINVEIPYLGKIGLISKEQLLEILSACLIVALDGRDAQEINRACGLTLMRETIIQVIAWVATHFTSEIPFKECKKGTLTHSCLIEFIRFTIDRIFKNPVLLSPSFGFGSTSSP